MIQQDGVATSCTKPVVRSLKSVAASVSDAALANPVLFQLRVQRTAIDLQQFGGCFFIAVAVVEDAQNVGAFDCR